MTLNQSPENKSRFTRVAPDFYGRPIGKGEQELSLDSLVENYQRLLETAPPSTASFFADFFTNALEKDGKHREAQKFARQVSRLNKKAGIGQ